MRDRYMPALVTLIAGAITCIIDIYRKADLLPSLKRLLLVIIIFYIISIMSRAIIRRVIEYKPDTSDEDKEDEAGDNAENIADDDTKIKSNDNSKGNPNESLARANEDKSKGII